MGTHVPDGIEHRLGRREGGRGHVGHGGVTGHEDDLVTGQVLARLIDLEVAESEETVRVEGLRSRTLGVRVGQVGPLGVVGGRDGPVRVEGVAHVQGDEMSLRSVEEGHGRSPGVDLPEVGHHRAGGQGADGHRAHRVFADPGPLGVELGEGLGAHRPPHGDEGPGAVIEVGPGPPGRGQAGVDPFDEVTDVVVALGGREPLRLRGPPPPVRTEDDVVAVGVVHPTWTRRPGADGTALARPVPVVQDADGVVVPGDDGRGDIRRLVVLLVGKAEARPGVELAPLTHSWYLWAAAT